MADALRAPPQARPRSVITVEDLPSDAVTPEALDSCYRLPGADGYGCGFGVAVEVGGAGQAPPAGEG